MNQSKIFQNSLEKWSKTSPKQAFMLPYVNCDSLEECMTANGEVNLRNKQDPFTYHAQSGALLEAEEWFKSLNLHKISMVCVYGIGLGYYYKAISGWLKRNRSRRVFFFEDDLAVIYKLFETELGREIISDPQVQLLYLDNIKEKESVLSAFYWHVAMKKFVVSALNSYGQNRKNILADLRHKISFDINMKNGLVDEYVDFGMGFYLNFYRNLLCLPDSYLGNALFKKFHKVPAIICGAGPSLEKHFAQIQGLLDHAVVFAGGSAINALNSAGFNPHFGVSIDPNTTQLKRMLANTCFEVPFFYRNRIYHEALKAIRGPHLYITGSGGYDTAEYFEKKFKIEDEFLDEGHNVINFCVEIAHAMGCDPIIFVGLDLAMTGMQSYAPGIVEDRSVSESSIVDVENEENALVPRTDIYGKPIHTLWKWLAESEWIGAFAKSHPLSTLINCTEGGIGFPNVVNRRLADVSVEYLSRSYDLKNRIHGEIQNARMPEVTYQKLTRSMRSLEKSLGRTIEQLDVLLEESRVMLDRLKNGSKDISQSGQSVLAEIELTEEDGYKYVVHMFNQVYSCMLSSKAHDIYRKNYSESNRLLKKLPFTIKKYHFLRDVARVNIEVIRRAFKEHKKWLKLKAVVDHSVDSLLPNMVSSLIHQSLDESHEDSASKPLMIPKNPIDGAEIGDGYYLRVIFDVKWKRYECYIEKDGMQDGQCLLYYPNGAVKQECFYKQGLLDGPSSFFGMDGTLLAKSWFIQGSQEGKCSLFYPNGAIYAHLNYVNNLQHGSQEYYNIDGSLKPKNSR